MSNSPTSHKIEYQAAYKAYETACLHLPLDKLNSYLQELDFSFFNLIDFLPYDYKVPFGKICLHKDWPRIEVFIKNKNVFPDETRLWSEGLYQTVSQEMFEFLPFFYNHPQLNFATKLAHINTYQSMHLGFARSISYSKEALRFMYNWLTEHELTDTLDKTKLGVIQQGGYHAGRMFQPLHFARAYFHEAGIQMALEELHITGLEAGLENLDKLLEKYPAHITQMRDTVQSNREKQLLETITPKLAPDSNLENIALGTLSILSTLSGASTFKI